MICITINILSIKISRHIFFFFLSVKKIYNQKYDSENTVQTTNEQKLKQNNNYIHTIIILHSCSIKLYFLLTLPGTVISKKLN